VGTIDRRAFLRLTAVVIAGPPLACSDSGSPPPADRSSFPHSVASGDPKPDSVVLWTRAVDPAHPDDDVTVTVEVALDAGFGQVVARTSELVAAAAHDHVVKVKVVGLAARTRYYYRFGTARGAYSPLGRTRTAPMPDDLVTVKLAFASCQDFAGRYYNTWQALLDRGDDLDFVLFIGDYIYEYAAGPPGRQVSFSDGATGVATTLGQYRDIYKAYRSDLALQQVHERYPFVVIWDDHEFANDCWGAHTNYSDGAVDESYPDRRRDSERAFFENLPIDVPGAPEGGGAYDLDAAPLYPDEHIYRELTFGACLRLLLTDYRSFRPDHLIPENAYPATVWLDRAGLDALVAAGQAPAALQAALMDPTFATVDVDAPALAEVKTVLLAAANEDLAKARSSTDAASTITGSLSLAAVNAVLAARSRTDLTLPATAATGQGFAFVHLGKRSWFTSLGSRYVVVQEMFELYANLLYGRSGGASERALGEAQEAWLYERLAVPQTDRWSMVVGSVSMSSLQLNLTGKPGIPPALATRLVFNADQWDGFPHKRAEILERIKAAGKGLFVAGDIHASYASVEGGVPCLTTPAISSSTASEEAAGAVASAGLDPNSSAVQLLLLALDGLFEEGNPALVVSDSAAHGMVVLDVDVDQIMATYHLVPATEVQTSYRGRAQALAAKSRKILLRVKPGTITRL
jgi:alkaline phosphatase D